VGGLVWPLTGLYLLRFFYILSFLVFTSAKSWQRYIVIPLWCLMLLDRIVAMLTRLGQRGYAVYEEPGEYRAGRNDTDSDIDPDPDGNAKMRPRVSSLRCGATPSEAIFNASH
jgi:hypothetical protein